LHIMNKVAPGQARGDKYCAIFARV